MVTFLFGENTYALEQALRHLVGERVPERIDGEDLELRDLPDIFSGQTLFADERLVVIRNASANMSVWNEVERYVSTIPTETTIILIETKPDKRTRTYKILQKVADMREFALPRNTREAEQFLAEEAKDLGMKLESKIVSGVVARVGTEPWNLVHALEKLAALDTTIDESMIEKVIEASPEAQIFGLLETALDGNAAEVRRKIAILTLSENAHQSFGFLSSQIVQLAGLVMSDESGSVTQDLATNPFVIRKLEPYVAKINRSGLRSIVTTLADCDVQLKSSGQDPWFLIETALLKVALRAN